MSHVARRARGKCAKSLSLVVIAEMSDGGAEESPLFREHGAPRRPSFCGRDLGIVGRSRNGGNGHRPYVPPGWINEANRAYRVNVCRDLQEQGACIGDDKFADGAVLYAPQKNTGKCYYRNRGTPRHPRL